MARREGVNFAPNEKKVLQPFCGQSGIQTASFRPRAKGENMDQMIVKYHEALRAANAACVRYQKVQRAVEASGFPWQQSQEHPEVLPLLEEYRRLKEGADVLSAFQIRQNLELFGLEDFLATGILRGQFSRRVLGQAEMLVSDLCAIRYSGLGRRVGIDDGDKELGANLSIEIWREGKLVGFVDCDGVFDFTTAETVREGLAWKVATDGGRVRLVNGFGLDESTERVLRIIRTEGISEDVFFGSYLESLRIDFGDRLASRFGDGYLGVATTLWRVATRQIGNPHEGYSFM